MKSQLSRLGVFSVYFVLGMTSVICSIVIYWLIYPYNILSGYNSILTLDKSAYRAGDNLAYRLTACKKSAINGEVHPYLVNGFVQTFPTYTSDLPSGCYNSKVFYQEIPIHTPTGKGERFGFVVIYKPNPIREVRYEFQSEPFEILPPK